MSREPNRYDRRRLHCWIMRAQMERLEQMAAATGKTKTDLVDQAIFLYYAQYSKMNEAVR